MIESFNFSLSTMQLIDALWLYLLLILLVFLSCGDQQEKDRH